MSWYSRNLTHCTCNSASEEPCGYCQALDEMEDTFEPPDDVEPPEPREYGKRDPRGDGPRHYVPPGF